MPEICGHTFDEMKVFESLVYDKSSSHIIGFVELNDAYSKLRHLEYVSKGAHVSFATHFFCTDRKGVLH